MDRESKGSWLVKSVIAVGMSADGPSLSGSISKSLNTSLGGICRYWATGKSL